MTTTIETPVRFIASSRSWIEGEAIRQILATAKLPGMRQAVGFPDLHPGQGGPIGAAFVTEGTILPSLVGGDIGCGMAWFKTDLLRRKAKLGRWAALPFDLEHPWEGDTRQRLASEELLTTQFAECFGTLGGGNHFAELQAVEKVMDPKTFSSLGLAKEELTLLVHSGSRGLGPSVHETHIEEHGAGGIDASSHAATRYLLCHDHALRWAEASRALIAERFLSPLGATGRRVLDACHNSITRVSPTTPAEGKRFHDAPKLTTRAQETASGAPLLQTARIENWAAPKGDSALPFMGLEMISHNGSVQETPRWLHRKGAAPADRGPLVIPGSRGTLSYLVMPLGDGADHAWSLAHGAGRKYSRSDARLRVRERFRPAQLVQTGLGSRVVCGDRSLLYEEAPPAYKDIEQVIADLVDAGLIAVIATLRPLLTYKTSAVRR